MRVPIDGKSIPNAVYSISAQPAPRPTAARPPESRSIAVTALASTAGWRKPTEYTNAPHRTREVSRASALCIVTASRQVASPG